MAERKTLHMKLGKQIGDFFSRILSMVLLHLRLMGEVHYINGPETLPPPLSPEEEAEIMQQILSGKEEAREPLITHNLRLVVYIAKKFESSNAGMEDLISIGTIGLIKAVNTFRPEKNIKLATYASRCIENEILMFLRKNSQLRNEISIDDPLNVDWDGNELLLSDILRSDQDSVDHNIEQEAEKNVLLKAVSHLAPRERQIMELRFGLGNRKEHTQKEVADSLGISQSYISRLEKRIIQRLKKDLERVS
jgi:RNA polymerase sporulation-specific sigma factor